MHEKSASIGSVARQAVKFLSKGRSGRAVLRAGHQLAATAHAPQSTIGRRVITRGLVGSAAGAGGSVIADKVQGRDVNVGRAVALGAAGGVLGAAAGTTSGKRLLRRSLSSKRTPDLSFKDSVKGLSSRRGLGAAAKNLSPFDKAYLGYSAASTVKDIASPESEGNRGRIIGSAAGDAGALLTASRWKGLRSGGRGGALGSVARSVALFSGASAAGGAIGSRFDRKPKIQKEAPYG